MKTINNKAVVSTDQLIEIAAQAANAKRNRPAISNYVNQMNPNSINNFYTDYKAISQGAEAIITGIIREVNKNGEFNGYAAGIITSNLMSMKDDIASGKLVIDISNHENINSFIETSLLERLNKEHTNDISFDNKLIDIMIQAANAKRL